MILNQPSYLTERLIRTVGNVTMDVAVTASIARNGDGAEASASSQRTTDGVAP